MQPFGSNEVLDQTAPDSLTDHFDQLGPLDLEGKLNIIDDSSCDGDVLEKTISELPFSMTAESNDAEESAPGKRQRVSISSNLDEHSSRVTTDDDATCSSKDVASIIGSREECASPYTEDEDDDIDTLPMSDGPLPSPSWSLTESLIAQKMAKLSMKDREEVYYDVHGVHTPVDEFAEIGFLDNKVKEMVAEVKKISAKERKAYELARTTNASYVDNRDFQLRFLRAERFDAKLAAGRYVRHYQTKLELFGPEKLGRDIVQDDLDEESLSNLYSGTNQILPRRDNTGRLVWLWIVAPAAQAYSKEALCRRIFYNNMLISEDLDTQRKGTVGIIYTLNQKQNTRGALGRDKIRSNSAISKSLPMPVSCIHFCYDNYAWLPVFAVAQMSIHLFIRLRIRAHFGSHKDCLYKLQTFGIPSDTIPVDETGAFAIENHNNFLQNRRNQEREWAKKKATDEEIAKSKDANTTAPSSSDVLLGRGSGYFNHVGNIRYRAMIEELKEKYDKSSNEGKQKTAEEVIQAIRKLGGRFLKNQKGVWIQVDDKVVRQKVGHSFRALRIAAAAQKSKATAAAAGPGSSKTTAAVTTMKRVRD